jgi:hypothetical protein
MARGGFGRTGGARTEETGMTEAELLALRTGLADQRRSLLDRLAIAAAAGKDDPEHLIEPGFPRLLAAFQTVIAAIDADLDVELEAELKEKLN